MNVYGTIRKQGGEEGEKTARISVAKDGSRQRSSSNPDASCIFQDMNLSVFNSVWIRKDRARACPRPRVVIINSVLVFYRSTKTAHIEPGYGVHMKTHSQAFFFSIEIALVCTNQTKMSLILHICGKAAWL